MSIAVDSTKSVANHRIIAEIDIGQENTQWVNIGAGIWEVNALNTYDYVDSSLLEGFTAQGFGDVSSVRVDGIAYQSTATLAELTDTTSGFFYDSGTRSLYVCFENYNEPYIVGDIIIGVTYSFSTRGFIPQAGVSYVEGRLRSTPSISISRDPLFFGRLQYGGATIDAINSDGEYDTWAEDSDIYGNEGRIRFGFDDVDYNDYEVLFTGYVERVRVSEETLSIQLSDKRKQLTKPITYSCTALNALTAIEEILEDAYGYPYNSVYYDTVTWEAARSEVESVTIDMQEPDPVIDVIEDICGSVFGLFVVTPDNRFSFVVNDTTKTAVAEIPADQLLQAVSVEYDPSEVVSSVRVGYAKDWATSSNAYTYYTDDTREASVFTAYKTYNQRKFDTMLPTLTSATAFASTVLDRSDTVKARATLTVPIEYYSVEIGDMLRIDVDRQASTMLGTKACEVLGKSYQLETPAVSLDVRIDRDAEIIRETEATFVRQTEEGDTRVIE